MAGALALIPLGAISPFYSAWVSPQEYAVTVQGLPVPAWSLIGVVGHMVIGGTQGLATGFAAGLSDVLSFGTKWLRSRLVFGLAAGLMHATYLIVAASARLLEPEASPVVYNLSSFVYGLLLGMLLSLVIPPLGKRAPLRRHSGRTLIVALSLLLVTVPYVYLTYPGIELRILPHRVALVWLLSFGLALAFIARSNDDQR